MYLNKIEIENYKGFERCAFEFGSSFNLIVGNNGTGKSSALEAIAIALSSFFGDIAEVSAKNISAKNVHVQIHPRGDAHVSVQYHTPTSITATFQLGGGAYQVTRERKDQSSNAKTTIRPRDICKKALELVNTPTEVVPVLSFHSAARVWQQKRRDFAAVLKATKGGQDRRCGYIGCFDDAIDTKGIEQWMINMEFMAFKKQQAIKEYEYFKQQVAFFMQEMDELDVAPVIYYSTQLESVVYQSINGVQKLEQLSAGYQSVLWIVMDLAYRISALNPHINPKETPVPGIVIIDEIDMHLHPKWQWRITDALAKTFPAVQFIIATHSPIVISSCKNAQISLLLEDHSIEYLPSGYGIAVNDILDLRLGSMEQPQAVSKLQNAFESALDDEDKAAATVMVQQMREQLGETHPATKSAENELALEWLGDANV